MYQEIDLSKFTCSSLEMPNILEALNRETPILTNDYDTFLKIPLNDNYIKNKQLSEAIVKENELSITTEIEHLIIENTK